MKSWGGFSWFAICVKWKTCGFQVIALHWRWNRLVFLKHNRKYSENISNRVSWYFLKLSVIKKNDNDAFSHFLNLKTACGTLWSTLSRTKWLPGGNTRRSYSCKYIGFWETHDGQQPILWPAAWLCPRTLLHDTIISHPGIVDSGAP